MKIYLSIFTVLLSIQLFAQSEWVEENSLTYSIKHPDSWIVRPSENPGELTMSGATDFEDSKEYVGTTLFVSTVDSIFSTMDAAAIAYKEKLLGTVFLENTKIRKEEKITFKGVDAVEIKFTAKIQHLSTACRIIIFQRDDIYYELSVTYDRKLSKKLLTEAYKVMESFEFID